MTAAAVPAVRVDAFGLTDPGKIRPANEDHFAIAMLRKAVELRQCSITASQVTERYSSPEAMVFVVADGVGGQPGGAFASETAITTLVWPRAYIVHVGDSRAFYLRRGRLRQLTRDQSMGEFMVESGAWTEEQARRARTSGVLVSALGAAEMTPALGLVDLAPGDTLLLCTDGLTKHVSDETIADVLGKAESAEAACRALVDAALADGGTDNVTAVVARMVSA